MWKPISYKKINEVSFAVDLECPQDGLIYTVSVEVGQDQDLHMDWMHYVYEDIDPEEEEKRLLTQGNIDNFDDALATAACYLESVDEIRHSDEQPWIWCSVSTEEPKESLDIASLAIWVAEALQSEWKVANRENDSDKISVLKKLIDQINRVNEDTPEEKTSEILCDIMSDLVELKNAD